MTFITGIDDRVGARASWMLKAREDTIAGGLFALIAEIHSLRPTQESKDPLPSSQGSEKMRLLFLVIEIALVS